MYVAHAWVDGYFDGAEVNHKDYDRTNYHADNLEWVSHKENVHHSSDCGRYKNVRNGGANGRARDVAMKIDNTNETMYFETIGDCAKWLINNKYVKYTKNINNVRSRIINLIKNKGNLNGLTFQYI